jgi:tRNA modification GTPase
MREGLHKIVSSEETIVAISTPPGRSGIGHIRISGPGAVTIAGQFFRSTGFPENRRAVTGRWRGSAGDVIVEVIVTYFRGPRSYTGEDVVEVAAHGNQLILNKIIECLQSAGARLAVPGEFTLRAVANGKMDLIQAEGVREFIEAQTEQQARIALRQMEGAISKRIRPVKEELVNVIAILEAGIDFAEDDVEIPRNTNLIERVLPLVAGLDRLRETFGYGSILRNGLRLAVIGKPNVGKSSLFNRLVSAERAIVTEMPGTTRDVVSESICLDGIALRVADTAGIRETRDEVESIGISRTFETLSEADLALVVVDGSTSMDKEDRRVLARADVVPYFLVINKSDLPAAPDSGLLDSGCHAIRVSAVTGEGLMELREMIRQFVLQRGPVSADDTILTSTRQYEAVQRACAALRTGTAALTDQVPHEMVLLDYYEALAALDELTGEVVSDDILDRIFSTFCVGK